MNTHENEQKSDKSVFKTISSKFLALYKDHVVKRYRNLADQQKFQYLLQTNEYARQLYGLSRSLCFRYENDAMYSQVFDTIDLNLIYGNVDSSEGSDEDYTDRLVKELLRYFKQDFFKWCDKPECINCNSTEEQVILGHQPPDSTESRYDCTVVEVYRCNRCGATTRFPRYNDPLKLLETRKGRCGEWCNLFMLLLKTFGVESRYIWNREDHVWCEFYSTNLKRWVHLDSCEMSFDQPYIYSINWGKKMSYVVAFGKDGVADISQRYILRNELPRDQISESDLQFLLEFITKQLRATLSDDEIYKLACRDEQEKLEWCTKTETEATRTDDSQKGRESGSAGWKQQRGEDGGL